MNKQEQAWSGEFGDEYLKRNRVDWRKRIKLWDHIMYMTGARSVLEFGCNAGWNLSAIKRTHPDVVLRGIEINQDAAYQASCAGLWVNHTMDLADSADLVFTAGVLIHIPDEKLIETMESIIENSFEYVLAIEYDSHTGAVEEVNYRGNDGMLWRRDYGAIYESLGLEVIHENHVSAADGFDDCKVWLMRKFK